MRVYSAQVGNGLALQVARPLDEVDHTLHRIGLYLLFIGLGGIGLASALGLLVGQATLRPVGRLTQVAEEVTETRDLSRRIGAGSRDELGRLASAFDEMLGALDSSLKAQRQLVADASHELRTPLASLRTNVEVLAGGKQLSADERGRLLADVIGQVEELSTLVGDLVELDPDAPPELEDVRLDELVAAVVERARLRGPKVEYRTELEESVVEASRPQLERAVSNLLDNAAKWSDSVEVRVAERRGDRARPRPRDRRGGPPPRLRPLLPGGVGAAPARLGPRARDRPPGRRFARRRGDRGERA